MNPSHSAISRQRFLLALLASAAIAITGCSNSMVSTVAGGTATPASKVGGNIHGGNQPVSGATVNLYLASDSSFASGATLAATTLSSSNGNGSFSFTKSTGTPNNGTTSTFSCPTNSTDPYVFVVAKGGTTTNTVGAVPNTDAEFIAPLGRCSAISASTNVYMSEVVTVATMAAIHAYMNPTNSAAPATPIESTVGNDGIFVSHQALTDAFSGVSNMVDLSTGLGVASVQRVGVGVTMTVTPEVAKINQLANIISSCINQTTSDSSQCHAIYNAATRPPSSAQTSVPGATQHAATDLLTALYNIFTYPTNGGSSNLTTLYNLSPASAPYQPTLSSVPTDWTIGIAYTASGTCVGSGLPFLNNPAGITSDINGNMFVSNTVTAGSQVEFDAVGIPIGCASVPSAAGLVVDASGNSWTGSGSANTITRYSSLFGSSLVFTTAAPVVSITADGFGDVFFSATNGNLYEIANGATAPSATTPIQINSATVGTGQVLIDPSNRVWAASGNSFITATQGTPSPVGTPTTLTFAAGATTTYATTAVSNTVAPTSSSQNGVLASGANTIQALLTSPVFTVNSGGGLNNPQAIALDGAQSVWVANGVGSSLTAFDNAGNTLTPSSGYVKPSNFLAGQKSVFVDASGNVWLGLSNSNTITEVVGAAVPVYQPYASNIQRYGQIP